MDLVKHSSTGFENITIQKLESISKRITRDNGCWNWTGAKSAGYGQTYNGKRVVGVHRLLKEITMGKTAGKNVIDHLCKNTICVNPKHLEPVTAKINTSRGLGPHPLGREYRSHCKRGHELVIENMYIKPRDGVIECRACRKLRRNGLHL